jgi:hypothetical protein
VRLFGRLQTKEAATDKPSLPPPRESRCSPKAAVGQAAHFGEGQLCGASAHRQPSAINGRSASHSDGHSIAGSVSDTGHSGKNSIRQVVGHESQSNANPTRNPKNP